jgi:hypothetical protein
MHLFEREDGGGGGYRRGVKKMTRHKKESIRNKTKYDGGVEKKNVEIIVKRKQNEKKLMKVKVSIFFPF